VTSATPNAARATTLVRALHAALAGDLATVRELCTNDVKAWAPALSVGSLDELLAELERRDDAFSDVDLDVAPLDVGGDYACAEWSLAMTHSGRLVLADGMALEPTGVRLALHGATVAEFRGERICSVRQYWDEFAVLEQLGVLSSEDL
jgi:ketosteroid isomerase-like protein